MFPLKISGTSHLRAALSGFVLSMTLRSSLSVAALIVSVNLAVAGDFDDGVAAVERGEHALALQLFRPLALRGDAKGQNGLGRMHNNGWGVPQNYIEAAKWYRRAADQRYASAQLNLGLLYAKGLGVAQNHKKAAELFRKAADQGEAAAQFNLGYIYSTGRGVRQDFAEALKWYRKSANQDFALAQYNIGYTPA